MLISAEFLSSLPKSMCDRYNYPVAYIAKPKYSFSGLGSCWLE